MRRWCLLGAMLVGCGSSASPDFSVEEPGPHPVGRTTMTMVDASRGRTLTVEAWYPADESARAAATSGEPIAAMVVDPTDRATYEALLTAAPANCPTRQTGAAPDAPIAAGATWPVVAFSHCHDCVRFSAMSVAERLASHGFVVVAPDHAGNTLFDELDGMGAELDTDTLAVRAADIRFVLDVMLDAESTEVPESLRGKLDADRVGVFGHSFGGVTTGMVVQDDPRPRAGLAIASPMENPLLEGVEIDVLDKPIGFLVAVEDNSITELGNVFIRRNFEDAPVPAWKAEVADAGHWSFSDICGVNELFPAGCGTGERQTDLTPFEYLPVASGKAIAQAYVTAYFRVHLDGDEGARLYLAEARPAEQVVVELRNY